MKLSGLNSPQFHFLSPCLPVVAMIAAVAVVGRERGDVGRYISSPGASDRQDG